jgi:hypothetical protein
MAGRDPRQVRRGAALQAGKAAEAGLDIALVGAAFTGQAGFWDNLFLWASHDKIFP